MQSRLSRTPGAIVVSVTLAAAAACGSDRTTAPAAMTNAALAATATRAQASLDDAATRLVPALGDELGSRGDALLDQLAILRAQLAAGDAAGANGALQRAREVLTHAGNAPDAAAIGLALDQVAAVLAPYRQ